MVSNHLWIYMPLINHTMLADIYMLRFYHLKAESFLTSFLKNINLKLLIIIILQLYNKKRQLYAIFPPLFCHSFGTALFIGEIQYNTFSSYYTSII